MGRQIRWWSRHVDAYAAGSESIKDEWVAHGLPPDRLHVVPFGIDPADYPPASSAQRKLARAALGLPAEGFVALFLGRVVPDKGVEVLLEAWRLLGLAPRRPAW